MRSRYFWNEGRVRKRQAACRDRELDAALLPRLAQFLEQPAKGVAPISSSNILRSSEIGSGCCAESSAASSTVFTFIRVEHGEFHVDGGVRLGLVTSRRLSRTSSSNREEIDDQHGHPARGLEQVAELREGRRSAAGAGSGGMARASGQGRR